MYEIACLKFGFGIKISLCICVPNMMNVENKHGLISRTIVEFEDENDNIL